jgi:hypothetical protein
MRCTQYRDSSRRATPALIEAPQKRPGSSAVHPPGLSSLYQGGRPPGSRHASCNFRGKLHVSASHRDCPSQIQNPAALRYLLRGRNLRLVMMAQIIRAILLASATAATFVVGPTKAALFHVAGHSGLRQERRLQVICRRYRSPCVVIPPSRSFPPLEFCRGTSPIQAARFRPDLKASTASIAEIHRVSPNPPIGAANIVAKGRVVFPA